MAQNLIRMTETENNIINKQIIVVLAYQRHLLVKRRKAVVINIEN